MAGVILLLGLLGQSQRVEAEVRVFYIPSGFPRQQQVELTVDVQNPEFCGSGLRGLDLAREVLGLGSCTTAPEPARRPERPLDVVLLVDDRNLSEQLLQLLIPVAIGIQERMQVAPTYDFFQGSSGTCAGWVLVVGEAGYESAADRPERAETWMRGIRYIVEDLPRESEEWWEQASAAEPEPDEGEQPTPVPDEEEDQEPPPHDGDRESPRRRRSDSQARPEPTTSAPDPTPGDSSLTPDEARRLECMTEHSFCKRAWAFTWSAAAEEQQQLIDEGLRTLASYIRWRPESKPEVGFGENRWAGPCAWWDFIGLTCEFLPLRYLHWLSGYRDIALASIRGASDACIDRLVAAAGSSIGGDKGAAQARRVWRQRLSRQVRDALRCGHACPVSSTGPTPMYQLARRLDPYIDREYRRYLAAPMTETDRRYLDRHGMQPPGESGRAFLYYRLRSLADVDVSCAR